MLTRFRTGARKALLCAAFPAVFAGVFLHVGAADLQAQTVRDWNDTGDPLQGALGLHYGKIGGHGLAFRLPLRWWLYFQVAGGLWHTQDQKQHNYGFNLNYVLRQDQTLRLFVGGGAAYFYDDEKNDQGVWNKETNWNWGAGVGIEILQGRRWSWKLEGDFIRHGNSGDIKITPQVGVFYYW
jgi:hypothetical protein